MPPTMIVSRLYSAVVEVARGRLVSLRELEDADAAFIEVLATSGDFDDYGPRDEDLNAGSLPIFWLLVTRSDGGMAMGRVRWHPVWYGPNRGSRAWNIGIILMPSQRGRGYGSEAQQLLAAYLFEKTDAHRVEAGTDVDNVAEQRALVKAGFEREGVLRGAQLRGGTHHDLVLYSVLRPDLQR